jgi:hypothetical protein
VRVAGTKAMEARRRGAVLGVMPRGDSEFRFELYAGFVAEFQFLKN